MRHPPLPTGPRAPPVVPLPPKPYWSWDRIPTSFHGADKERLYNDSEIARLAKYQMVTPEKWSDAHPPPLQLIWCPDSHSQRCLSTRATTRSRRDDAPQVREL